MPSSRKTGRSHCVTQCGRPVGSEERDLSLNQSRNLQRLVDVRDQVFDVFDAD